MEPTSWWTEVLKKGLAAVVMLTALYLLYIAYKMALRYMGGKKGEGSMKYLELHLSEKNQFSEELEIGVEGFEPVQIQLSLLDNKMNLVAVIYEGEIKEGIHPFAFDLKGLNEGYYFVNLSSDFQKNAKKIYVKNA